MNDERSRDADETTANFFANSTTAYSIITREQILESIREAKAKIDELTERHLKTLEDISNFRCPWCGVRCETVGGPFNYTLRVCQHVFDEIPKVTKPETVAACEIGSVTTIFGISIESIPPALPLFQPRQFPYEPIYKIVELESPE